MKITKDMRLTHKEKLEILKKWNHREMDVGEINYVEELVLQKVKSCLELSHEEA